MATMQLATRVDEEQGKLFKEIAKKLGTTPSDALRIFVATFNENRGFPYDVRLAPDTVVEPFEDEKDATRFATNLALRMSDETR